jgi:hypothetical protein
MAVKNLQYPPLNEQSVSCHTSNNRRYKVASQLIGSIYDLKIEKSLTLILILNLTYFNSETFFSHGAAAQRGLWPPNSRGFRDHTHDAPPSSGLLWTSDQSVAETST